MRIVFVTLILALITTMATAEEGPWSAPNWHLGATEQHGPFVTTTSMHVSPGPGYDRVEVTCTVQDVRGGSRPDSVRRQAKALYRQDAWCGDAGDLGNWCVALHEGARLEWFGKSPCAGGVAQFSTGD